MAPIKRAWDRDGKLLEHAVNRLAFDPVFGEAKRPERIEDQRRLKLDLGHMHTTLDRILPEPKR